MTLKLGIGSLKVIESAIIQQLGYGFLLDFYINYSCISHSFRDTPTYWSKIAQFSHPLFIGTPVRGEAVGVKQPLVTKTRMMGLSGGKKISTKCLAVLIQSSM